MSTYFSFSERDATAVSQHTTFYKSFYLCLLINQSICIYIYIYFSQSILRLLYLSRSLYLSLCIHLSIHLLIYLFINLSIFLSIHLSFLGYGSSLPLGHHRCLDRHDLLPILTDDDIRSPIASSIEEIYR
jgi:hypothetical protein